MPPATTMDLASERSSGLVAFLRDCAVLAKPRLSALVLVTTACGLWLAPAHVSGARIALTLIATTLVVAAAQTLNCYLERDIDARMVRTRERPLPAQRLDPRVALWQGLGLAAISLPALTFGVNALTGLLAAIALVSYVLVYTPMKPRTSLAVFVGALPGAIPPLLGWTAATGSIDPGGLGLFSILFVWQLPHFLAIAIYLQEDYARGGIRVVPLARGDLFAKLLIIATTAALVPVSLSLVPLGVGGGLYWIAASVLGLIFLGWSMTGLLVKTNARWARGFFFASLVYLPLLLGALMASNTGGGRWTP